MEYTFIKTDYSKEKINTYAKLLSQVFPDTKKYTPEFLNWQYNKNPFGKVVGYDAFYDNELAAHYVAIPVEYVKNGNVIKGLLSLNTATHPAHQGKGLFTKLAELTYNAGEETGYQFVIGVANQNSTHGFLKKLGFKLISSLEVQIFPARPKIVNPASDFFQSHWTKETADWRMQNPVENYFSMNGCLSVKTHLSYINAVLSCREIFSTKPVSSSFLKMTIGLNIKNKGMKINLPAKLKPSPLNLIFKPLGNFNLEVNKSNLFFELIDFDAY